MGAVAGILQLPREVPEERVLDAMDGRLASRGHAGATRFTEGPVALLHRARRPDRVPVVADDVVLFLDGWVMARHPDETTPAQGDHAVLAWAWERWGTDWMDHLEGEYAAAIWDRRRETLHLIRDRFGTRPLFWARRAGRVAFSSDLPALLEVPWVGRELARDNLAEYLSFRVVHAPRTLLSDVSQVEPGHRLEIDTRSARSLRWWTPAWCPPDTPFPREGDVVAALQTAVDAAVRRRLEAVPETGIYLSGGGGSTAIAAACRASFRKLPTFTVSFADDLHPEAPFAGRVARLLGLEHETVRVGTKELADAFEPTVAAMGIPVGSPSALLQLILAQGAAKHVSIILAGEGGDELFGGRGFSPPARQIQAARAFNQLPSPLRDPLGRILRRTHWGRRVATPPQGYGLALGLGGARVFGGTERKDVLADAALVRAGVRRRVMGPWYEEVNTDPLNAILNASTHSTLTEADLVRADRTAAAAGMEIRFPLLDLDVVRLVTSLPGRFKIDHARGLHARWLLRALLDGVLPQALIHRPDRSLPMPHGAWLMGPGRLFMEDRFLHLLRDPLGLWRREGLLELRAALERRPEAGLQLWCLFILDAWLEGIGAH